MYTTMHQYRDRRIKHIVCFSRCSVQGKAAKNRRHQKEHQRRDIGKNPFSIFVYAIPFQTWRDTRYSTEIFSFMRRVLFLFRCADFIINGLLSFGINGETRSRT